MLVPSFCASRPRSWCAQLCRSSDSVLRRSRRSSVAAALQPSTQLVVFVASRGTRRHLEGRRELRAASAPSQQHPLRRSSSSTSGRRQCPATMIGRRGLVFWKYRLTPP